MNPSFLGSNYIYASLYFWKHMEHNFYPRSLMVEDNYTVLMMYIIEPTCTFVTNDEPKMTHSYHPKSSLP